MKIRILAVVAAVLAAVLWLASQRQSGKGGGGEFVRSKDAASGGQSTKPGRRRESDGGLVGEGMPEARPPATPAMKEAERLLNAERHITSQWQQVKLRRRHAPAAVWESEVKAFRAKNEDGLKMIAAAGRPDPMEPTVQEAAMAAEQARNLDRLIAAAGEAFGKWCEEGNGSGDRKEDFRRWVIGTSDAGQFLAEARVLSLQLHRDGPELVILRQLGN
jgi:hypothetical protein